jgi:ankyrin repeat protein
MEINNNDIFNLIKEQKFDNIYKLIKDKQLKNFNFKDMNYNYFIHYLIIYNQIDIFKLFLELHDDQLKENKKSTFDIRIDISDTDGRNILYNCIKFNYITLLELLIEINKRNIGISIINLQDRNGYTALHYCVLFNNFDAFKILIENDADPYIMSKDGANIFIICLMYKRNNMINYLLDKKFHINFTNNNDETLLQVACTYGNIDIINKLFELPSQQMANLDNKSNDSGLTILHQSIILDNYELFEILLNKKIDFNAVDFYGNSALHYCIMNVRIKYLIKLIKISEINYNSSNINGDIPLHILLNNYNEFENIDNTIIEKILVESDLNIQDNNGITCLMLLDMNNLLETYHNILIIKPLNFYIENNKNEHVKITDTVMNILVESYYNMIKQSKAELILDWEKWCSADLYDKLKTLIPKNSKHPDSKSICMNKIKDTILKEKRTLPRLSHIDMKLEQGIFTNYCYYTGSPIDIIFGLILLHDTFNNDGLNIMLDYPLTINTPLEDYYKKISLDYPYKLDFSNIEILWSYQKLFYPSYFNDEILNLLKNKTLYIVIPIGIETSLGSHANILFWDVENNTLERFEPNGSNYPIGLNYNPKLLDTLIESKFKQFNPKIVYYPPYNFLPSISFQILENLETPRCKKIGDPNGFCGVWCIWWVYQRMLNIKNKKLNINNIANELIKYIKFDNMSFKTLIRNFSSKITDIRDLFLKKYKIDINDWILENYDIEILNNLEKDILRKINKI